MQVQKSFKGQSNYGTLYLVPTPIGNLQDMTFRSVQILKEVDLICAEDTRNTGLLLKHFEIETKQYSFHEQDVYKRQPFFNNYRPQFYFRTTDVTGSIELPAGTEMVMPGDNVTIDVELIHPIAVEKGTTFSIREGGRTVGSGIVTEIEA